MSSSSENTAPASESAKVTVFGKVDSDGNVSVLEGESWRVVGQYPDGTSDEALAYFERKYQDLASELTLLEVRHRRGGASAKDLLATAKSFTKKLDSPAVVGDIESLNTRLAALQAELLKANEQQSLEAKAAVEANIAARTELAEKAEALSAQNPQSVQWKVASAQMNELFEQWKKMQAEGPKLPRAVDQQIWRRFRDARNTFEQNRRSFFADLDQSHKSAKEEKERLIVKAEALASRGEDGIPAYRDLLDAWKKSPRAGRKADDALWAKFKAAGDVLYSVRSEREQADAAASDEKIIAKKALLVTAAEIADIQDLVAARAKLTEIQRQWDEIGRIFPRDKERAIDGELRNVEKALRTREDDDWRANDPETKARANDMTRQLNDKIAKLQSDLDKASAANDKKKVAELTAAIETQKSWLAALS